VHGVVAVIRQDNRMLVIQRAANIRAGGAWCFPGGAMEPGETIEQAAIREINEELGITIVPEQVIWEWLRPDGQLRLYWVLAEIATVGTTTAEIILRPSPTEVADVRWVTPAEFRVLSPTLPSNLLFLEHYEKWLQG